MKKISKIPTFKSLEEERRFWDTHRITDFMDELGEVRDLKFPKPKHILIDLKPSQFKTLHRLAAKLRLSSKSLIKKWVAQKLSEEALFN